MGAVRVVTRLQDLDDVNNAGVANGRVFRYNAATGKFDSVQLASTDLSDFTQAVDARISLTVANAPTTLDTLKELADALGDDPNFSTTITTALGLRVRVDTAAQGLTGTQQSNARTNLGLGSAATQNATTFLQVANNLSDLNNVGTARTNLGLGTMATQAEANYALLAGRAGGQTYNGGTGAGESITINSTTHATKGKIFFGASSAYDGANVRLGIGTTNPVAALTVQGAASNTVPLYRITDGTAQASLFMGSAAPKAQFGTETNDDLGFFTNNTNRLFLTASGLVGVNKFSGIGAQLHVVAKDASTKGIRVGMAASPTSTSYPFSIADSTETTISYFDTAGRLELPDGAAASPAVARAADPQTGFRFLTNTSIFAAAGSDYVLFDTAGVTVRSTGCFKFASSGVTTPDASVCRNGANIVSIGDGGANANGTLKAARFQFSTTITPTSSADAQGNTGDVRYDDNFVYVKSGTRGWVRAALSTF